MSENCFYVTTPIYYVNDKPHLGHSYTTIMCDIMRRYHALLGADSYFLTGTDEYGQNIMRVAQEKGLDVQAMVDANSMKFRELWPKLNISNDDFIRTTEERHKKVVQMILQRTYDNGDIFEAEYGGNYCVKCERFFTDKETESHPGHCPIHDTALEFIKEKNYFFPLKKYQGWLRDKIEGDPGFLQPAQFRSEVLAILREPLDDLCISRPRERLHWGVPLPFDPNFVTYVWYDALTNYISALDYPDGEKFRRYWPEATHMIAKDILRQHAVYWPCFLKAAGIEPFKRLRVHGWWTVEGKKMSKSLGNVIDPLAEAEKWGLDIYRYFLAREMTFGSDGDYSSKALVGRNNSELADDLGNLLSRVVAMIHRYFDGQMPEIKEANAEDAALLKELDLLAEELPGHLERCAIHSFLERVNQTVVAVNKYLTDQAPWTLAKSDKFERVGSVLAVACQMLAGVGKLLSPVMPDKMGELLAVFGLPRPTIFKNEPVAPGTAVQKVSPLFPQLEWIDPAAAEASLAAQANNTPTEAGKGAFTPVPPKPEIPFDDFAKVDLRIATVKVAERVPKTDKLMRLEIDLGFETRQIVAGVAEKYSPEQLIGRQIVVVANLAPRKLKGLESKGMLLAGRAGDELLLLRPDNTLPPGADVS